MNNPAQAISPVHFGHQGRVVIVTGGAQGIGEACVRRFASEGARVVVADVLPAPAWARKLGIVCLPCDVGSSAAVDAMVAQVVKAFGRVDILVNNAGMFRASPFLDISESDFDAVLRVNLKGSFLVAQAVARCMVLTGTRGSIVNMSSVNGVLAIPEMASYNISKGGINQLTRAMALALADQGIRVNAVAPGTIATELAAQAVLTSQAARNKVLSRTPLKRLGTPAEVADVVAWLASDAASYVTGEIVTVDGGRMALNYTVPV
ncbi:SDR family oxidoreductase [Hydrogenophaga sp. PAMC20947]|uniref:SDR family NAD(P)-dependent oxidoreductase n=1 Tax=Hydrogenophaga sp. PAMC20947 TaxID=2565558 RepID=UPI00109DD232|nr:SDR family oxidoreductase [Hydrogenophaga sp. PAMC20947]QCB48526.1 SDR family oxidoreductase [Hydrogenophaga sp. PAMC20947]